MWQYDSNHSHQGTAPIFCFSDTVYIPYVNRIMIGFLRRYKNQICYQKKCTTKTIPYLVKKVLHYYLISYIIQLPKETNVTIGKGA